MTKHASQSKNNVGEDEPCWQVMFRIDGRFSALLKRLDVRETNNRRQTKKIIGVAIQFEMKINEDPIEIIYLRRKFYLPINVKY